MAGKLSTWFSSTRLFLLGPCLAAALLTACGGGAGGAGAVPATVGSQNSNSPLGALPQTVTAPTVPPEGVYNSCEIDTALTSMCEQEDAAMASDGYKWEVNYIGIDAKKTGSNSLKAWFTYDASIGLGQAIAIEAALKDPSNVLTGKILLSSPYTSSLASSCGATNNEQVISCIYSVAKSVPGFNWMWYIYDEPGCPNQSIGYCQASLAGGNYQNVQTLAKYIASIDASHQIIGTQVGDNGDQTVINTLYSWLTNASTATTGFDHYPIPSGGNFGSIGDIGTIAGEIANTITANYASEKMYFVGQAFSWFQESGAGCTSISVCPFPTTAQLQDMRDQALYYANKAGVPLSMIFWYYWPDVTCLNNYSGCNAAANRASLKSAAFAPFPATPPPPTPTPAPTTAPTSAPAGTGSSAPSATPAPTATPAHTATPAPTSQPVATATLPPQGVYNSCEIDTALTSMCEQEDAAMASDGYKWEINYIGLDANKTGSNSLQAWFTYDASIGLGQAISLKAAINDPVNVLTGTALLSQYTSSLANSCGATNNEQIIACIYSVASSVPGFNWEWYTYDEPGCPNQSIGYCQGTLAGGNYNNVATLANYIHSLDPTHPVIGTEVGDVGAQTVTNTEFSWLLSPASPVTGFDHYPIPQNGNWGTIDDIGTLATQLANTIAANYGSEKMYFVGQAFSWYQEGGGGCTSITVCPYPTTAQLQDERDQALYYANKAGNPMTAIFWYYWPDITCLNSYSGCSAAANRASLKSAAFAPFPASPPQ